MSALSPCSLPSFAGDAQHRSEVGGVPIDAIEIDEAISRVMSAVSQRSFMQVCTVNLDFLVNARRDEHLRSILTESHLNLADGSPVVWLGRIRGQAIPHRIAGADFVSRLIARAAEEGTRVFLLGGEDGAAAAAAAHLVDKHPDLMIAGAYEPPRSSVADMDVDGIMRRLEETGAGIVLVALGHPKQEKLIHQLGLRVPGVVAIGVGCTLDLMAGRRDRAPGWMQRHGLEWLYRLVHEPRRLFSRYASDAWWLLAVLMPLAVMQRLDIGRGRRL